MNSKDQNAEIANWQRIKKAMEENGTTDNIFYQRACAIVAGKCDPLNSLKYTKAYNQ